MSKNNSYRYLANFGDLGKKSVRGKGDGLPLQFVREAWGDYECFAIRIFNKDGSPERGIGLTAQQAKNLRDALNAVDFERYQK